MWSEVANRDQGYNRPLLSGLMVAVVTVSCCSASLRDMSLGEKSRAAPKPAFDSGSKGVVIDSWGLASSMGKSTHCSSRGPVFSSQHLHGNLELSVTPI